MSSALTAPLRSSSAIALAFLALCLSACATSASRKTAVAGKSKTPSAPLYAWTNESATGSPSVKIDLSQQKAFVYRGGTPVAWTVLASGVEAHPTPTGHFSVMEKLPQKHSNLYGVIEDGSGDVVNWDARAGVSHVPSGCHFVGASMPHWMRLTSGGVGMHAGDIPNPGHPASHGCIRLPAAMADRLYELVEIGTPVTVSGTAPY